MSDLKPKGIKIELDGKEYNLLFSLNVIEDFQDKFDTPISKIQEIMGDERKVYKATKFLLAALINEALDEKESGDEHISEKAIGRKVNFSNIRYLNESIMAAAVEGMPQITDEDIEEYGDEDPNETSE